jgi:hypothetical protein
VEIGRLLFHLDSGFHCSFPDLKQLIGNLIEF